MLRCQGALSHAHSFASSNQKLSFSNGLLSRNRFSSVAGRWRSSPASSLEKSKGRATCANVDSPALSTLAARVLPCSDWLQFVSTKTIEGFFLFASFSLTTLPHFRTIILFRVRFQDAVEQVLARLILQQFSLSQSQIHQQHNGVKASTSRRPHCEFRRPSDPPLELQNADGCNEEDVVGFVSFVFFPSHHLPTLASQKKATHEMMNFLTYLDDKVKDIKGYMQSQVRNSAWLNILE